MKFNQNENKNKKLITEAKVGFCSNEVRWWEKKRNKEVGKTTRRKGGCYLGRTIFFFFKSIC